MDILSLIQQIFTYIAGFLAIIFPSTQINPPNKINRTCSEGFLGSDCEIGNLIYIFQKSKRYYF